MNGGYRGGERDFWEERILRQDRYSSIGVRSLPETVNRCRKEALFPVIQEALGEQDLDLRGARVLDAACGTGVYAELYASLGADVVGVDLSRAALEACHRWGVPGGFAVADLSALPFPDGSFELTHAFSVLYHIVDERAWRTALAELARVTRRGGHLVMRIEWVEKGSRRADHVSHRARAEYLRVLEAEESFELRAVHPFRDLMGLRPLFVAAHRLLPGSASERLGTLVERLGLLSEHPEQKVVVFRKR